MPGGRLTRSLLAPFGWFYPTAKAAYRWRMRRTHDAHALGPVLVLQMGKVGSKSVQAGLQQLSLDRAIYHAHFLSPERTAKVEKQRRKFFRTDRESYLRRPWLNQFLLDRYQDSTDERKWKLVTLVREPVGRNISAFFENLTVTRQNAGGEFEISSDYYQIDPTRVSVDEPEKLAELFFSRATHDSPLKFFDREIRDIFGIDVLTTGFAREKGYQIYSSGKVDLLVLKLECLQDCVGDAFKEFLGVSDFPMISRNVGADKVYAPLYDAFKSQAVITAEYADKLYESRFMRTFYDDREIDAARNRWIQDHSEHAA